MMWPAHASAVSFIGRIAPGGLIVTSLNDQKAADVEVFVDGVFCRVRTEDGRVWRTSGAYTGDWTNFLIVED